jgi:uncharacterized repeat protein (TIGR01451 family)
MKLIKFSLPFISAFMIIAFPILFLNQRTTAQGKQFDFPPPPHLEPTAIQNSYDANRFVERTTNTLASTDVITNVLGVGNDQIHGLIYFDGSLWASTRTSPARILRINPSNLAVENQIDLQSGQNEAEDITAGQGYVWTILYTNPAQLIRIDPNTNSAQTAITFQDIDPAKVLAYGASLKYAFGFLWAGGINHLAKIDITNPDAPTYQIQDFSSIATDGYVLISALTNSNNHLWGIFEQFSLTDNKFFASTIIKIDPATPTTGYITFLVDTLFPDDITYAGTHFYTSSEDQPNIQLPSNMYIFNDSLTAYSSMQVSNHASYGTFLDPYELTNFWGAYVNSPGKIIKFDLNGNTLASLNLPLGFNDPSEIAFDDAGNMYVSTWQIPSGIVKYTVAEISSDLGITKTASPDPAIAGQELRYTLSITNSGPVGATNVVVNDTLPSGVTFLSSLPGLPNCSHSNGSVICNLGSLLANQSVQINIRVLVNASTFGKITNNATVTSSEHDTNNSNNNVAIDTQVFHHINLPIIIRNNPQ